MRIDRAIRLCAPLMPSAARRDASKLAKTAAEVRLVVDQTGQARVAKEPGRFMHALDLSAKEWEPLRKTLETLARLHPIRRAAIDGQMVRLRFAQPVPLGLFLRLDAAMPFEPVAGRLCARLGGCAVFELALGSGVMELTLDALPPKSADKRPKHAFQPSLCS